MDWVISLVAVLVSLVTVVISYLTNRENLKNASQNMLTEHAMKFRVSVWGDIILLCDKLVQLTGLEHFERAANLVATVKSDPSAPVADTLEKLQAECEQIRSTVFQLCAKASTLDDDPKELLDNLHRYGKDAVGIYERLENFCVAARPTRAEYDAIVAEINKFGERNLNFSHGMQEYIVSLESDIFGSGKENKK